MAMYLLGYPFTVIMICIGDLALLLGQRGAATALFTAWAHGLFLLASRPLHVQRPCPVDVDRPYLVVANHASLYDIPALVGVFPGLALMGREYLARIPLLGYFLRAVRYIPIDTESIRKAGRAIEEAIARAREGIWVGMFPEGTRTLHGDVQHLKRGFVRVLRASGLDLLPVRIDGTFHLKPKGALHLNPRERIVVTVRCPLANRDLVRMSDEEIMERVRDALRESEGGQA